MEDKNRGNKISGGGGIKIMIRGWEKIIIGELI